MQRVATVPAMGSLERELWDVTKTNRQAFAPGGRIDPSGWGSSLQLPVTCACAAGVGEWQVAEAGNFCLE